MNDEIVYGPEWYLPRGLFDDDGRLSQEELRAKLNDLGIVQELERRGLWLDKQETTNSAGVGIGFRDLEELYSHEFSPVKIEADKTLIGSSAKLLESAEAIKRALVAYRWARSNGAVAGFEYEDHFIILRRRKGDASDIIDWDGSGTERDFLDYLAACAASLELIANRVSGPGNRSNAHKSLYCKRWTEFALSKCNNPLHAVGCSFYQIIFGTEIDEESFKRACRRVNARARKAKTGLK